MSDVRCAACGEPWEVYHLRHDLIWEIISPTFWDEVYNLNVDPNWGLPTRIDDGGGLEPRISNAQRARDQLRHLWRGGRNLDAAGVREEFKKIGWEFGSTIMNIRHCGCCPPGTEPKRDQVVDEAELLLGYDLDGLASTLEDHYAR